jgi:pyruvate/2-oxoglutarate dehydrogenase complex dihydrolipoamide acyltransferase (E2) component
MTAIIPFPKERKHTLFFLQYARSCSPVYIDTDVDMSKILKLREDAGLKNQTKHSIISYFIYTAARVIAKYPQALSSISGGLIPRVAQYNLVNAKFTLDKNIGSQRAVLSAVVTDANKVSVSEIQEIVSYYKNSPFEEIKEFAGIKKLHKLPLALGQTLFNLFMANLTQRNNLMGTFSVSSLGHKAVNSFFSTGGTTLTFGIGRIQSRPVVQNQQITIAPLMRLSMTFDHRLIDGAMAADILNDIKEALENFNE